MRGFFAALRMTNDIEGVGIMTNEIEGVDIGGVGELQRQMPMDDWRITGV